MDADAERAGGQPEEGEEGVMYDDESDSDEEVFVDPNDENIVLRKVAEYGSDEMDADEDSDDEAGAGGKNVEEEEDVVDLSKRRLEGHTDPVYAVAICPANSACIATGSGDDTAGLWNRETGERLHTLEGHTDSVVDVKFNVAGTLLASAGMDGLVKVWTVADGAEAKTLDGPTEDITWVQWHPKGDIVLAGSSDMSVWMWNAGTGDSMMVFSGHTDSVTCGSFSEDGRLVMTGSADGSARVWNPKDGNCVVTMQDARGNSKGAFHEQAVQCLHTVGNLLLTGSEDATAILTQITTDEYGGFAGKVIARFRHHTHSVEAVAIHPVSHYCATGSLDGKVMVYESHADAPRFVCAHDAGVTRVQWMRARDVLLSAGMDRTVRAWDGRGGAPLAVWTGHRDVVFDVAASADGAHVVSGADDNDALCWQFSSA